MRLTLLRILLGANLPECYVQVPCCCSAISYNTSLSSSEFIVTGWSLHQINLHGPWELESESSGECSVKRFKYPCLLDKEFAGRLVKVSRRFHQPSGLDNRQPVYLDFKFNALVTGCSVNDHPIDSLESRELYIEVTQLLQPFNKVELSLTLPDSVEPDHPVFASSQLVIG